MSLPITEAFPQGNPYLEALGVQVLEYGDDRAVMALTLKPEFMNSWRGPGRHQHDPAGCGHGPGGALGAPDAKSSATVEMSTSFLQPAGHAGETIIARGHTYHRSTTMCFCQAELFNGDRLVAKAMGTFKLIRRLDISRKLDHE
jgi:acyl-coenzyme A thioesterase PaaI-like protein